MPPSRNRSSHLPAVLALTRKAAAAAFRVAPLLKNKSHECLSTAIAQSGILMNVHSIPPKTLFARHKQLLRFKSNGQPLERSQVPQWVDRMRQGTRLPTLARLVLWAADRARWWCVTIAGIAQIALFRLIRPPYSALFGSPSNFGVVPKNHTAPRPCPRESMSPSLFK